MDIQDGNKILQMFKKLVLRTKLKDSGAIFQYKI